MRCSQNLSRPPRMYSILPEYTPLLDMRPSQNLSIPPEYTPFWATICNAHIIYPSLPEYTPFYIKWGSRNLPHICRIYPPCYNYICDAPRIHLAYMILTESTPLSCLDKCACSRRHIYGAYITSMGIQCVQCIMTIIIWHCHPRGVVVAYPWFYQSMVRTLVLRLTWRTFHVPARGASAPNADVTFTSELVRGVH